MLAVLRPILAAFLMAISLALLAGCLRAPIGDPESSRSDADLTGAWFMESIEEKAVGDVIWLVHRYDPRTFLVQTIPVELDPEGGTLRVPAGRSSPDPAFKAWTIEIEGSNFITAQPFTSPVPPIDPDDVEPVQYFIARFTRADDHLILEVVSDGFEPVNRAQNAQELEAVIRSHITDPRLFSGAITLRAMTPEETDWLYE